jgi:hypothetical protein
MIVLQNTKFREMGSLFGVSLDPWATKGFFLRKLFSSGHPHGEVFKTDCVVWMSYNACPTKSLKLISLSESHKQNYMDISVAPVDCVKLYNYFCTICAGEVAEV